MRIVYIGTVEFSREILEHLLSLKAEVVGVCTSSRRKFNNDFADLTSIAESRQVPVLQIDDINSIESIAWIKSLVPDIVFCFGWSRLLSEELLNVAPKGVLGYHPSLLPSNRGRHPLIWALTLGLEKTGSTFFFMNKEADEGEIVSQEELMILYEDDAATLYRKMIRVAKSQISVLLPLLSAGRELRVPQTNINSNIWRKRSPKDGLIDWRMSSRSIYNLVRALSHPYPGADIVVKGDSYKVWKVTEVRSLDQNYEPGKIIGIRDGNLIVKCGEGAVILDRVHPPIEIHVGEYL